MNDMQGGGTVRPTKKQREILTFIEQFITEHGYSPSYREIMTGLNYTSVATVSLHVNSLIRRGHLRKRDRSARSLEVVSETDLAAAQGPGAEAVAAPKPAQQQGEAWLTNKVESAVSALEGSEFIAPDAYDDAVTLVSALKVLGQGEAYASAATRLNELEGRVGKGR